MRFSFASLALSVAFLLAPVVAQAGVHVDVPTEQRALSGLNQTRQVQGHRPARLDALLQNEARYYAAQIALSGNTGPGAGSDSAIAAAVSGKLRLAPVGAVIVTRTEVAAGEAAALQPLPAPGAYRIGVGAVVKDGRMVVVTIAVAETTPDPAFAKTVVSVVRIRGRLSAAFDRFFALRPLAVALN